MAGYDFRVPVKREERQFARLLLRHLQHMAILRACDRPTTVRYRWRTPTKKVPYHNYHAVVEGDFAELQGLATEALTALQHFGAGVVASGSASSDSMLPQVTPITFYKATVEIQEKFERLSTFIAEKGIPGPLVNSYLFAEFRDPPMDTKIRALSTVLVGWRNLRVPAETVLEQTHTVLELLLKRAIDVPNRGWSFAQLLDSAVKGGILTDSEHAQLTTVKNTRRDGKHRSQSVSEEKLAELLPTAVGVIHRLIAGLAARDTESAG